MKEPTRHAILRAAATSLVDDIESIETELGTEELPEQQMVEKADQLDSLVGGTTTVFDSLVVAGQQGDGEMILTPLLGGVARESAQAAIAKALESIESAHTREFNVALARWLSNRPTATLLDHVAKLDASQLKDGAALELGEILARLWREADTEESPFARQGFERIGELHRSDAGASVERLAEEVKNAFEHFVTDEATANRQRTRIELLEMLVAEHLLTDQAGADVLVDWVNRALAEQPSPGEESGIASLLVEALEWAPGEASEPLLQSTKEALDSSPWIGAQPPFTQIIRLQIEAGLARSGLPDSPYGVEELAELAAAHGAQFNPAVLLWLDRYGPDPGAVATVLQPFLDRRLSSTLEGAVKRYTVDLDAAGQFLMIQGLLQSPYSQGKPRPELLRQLGIEGADPEQVTVSIIDRFKISRKNPEREAALSIWRAFAPTKSKYRKKLIQKVFVPLCSKNVGGYELCRKYLDLCARPPRGTKDEILDVIGAAPDAERLEKMRKRMKEVGLKPLPKR